MSRRTRKKTKENGIIRKLKIEKGDLHLRHSELEYIVNSVKCIQFMIENGGLDIYLERTETKFGEPWLFTIFLFTTNPAVLKLIFETDCRAIHSRIPQGITLLHFVVLSAPRTQPYGISSKVHQQSTIIQLLSVLPFHHLLLQKTSLGQLPFELATWHSKTELAIFYESETKRYVNVMKQNVELHIPIVALCPVVINYLFY